MGHRHRPAGSARDLPRRRRAGGFVHRGPHSAEATAADQARRLLLVADQLQRHHRHQGVHGTSTKTHVLKDKKCVCTCAVCVWVFTGLVCVSFRELRVYLWAPRPVRAGALALSPISPTTAMAWGTRQGRNTSSPPSAFTRYHGNYRQTVKALTTSSTACICVLNLLKTGDWLLSHCFVFFLSRLISPMSRKTENSRKQHWGLRQCYGGYFLDLLWWWNVNKVQQVDSSVWYQAKFMRPCPLKGLKIVYLHEYCVSITADRRWGW